MWWRAHALGRLASRRLLATRAEASDRLVGLLAEPSTLLQTQVYIGGEWAGADGAAAFSVTDPATGSAIASVADCGAAETRRAIDAAQRAFAPWASRPAPERSAILRRWYDLINQHRSDLATLVTLESGKPLAEARAEVASGADSVAWFAEEGRRADGEALAAPSRERRFLVLRQPIGVVGASVPW